MAPKSLQITDFDPGRTSEPQILARADGLSPFAVPRKGEVVVRFRSRIRLTSVIPVYRLGAARGGAKVQVPEAIEVSFVRSIILRAGFARGLHPLTRTVPKHC
jgi:hypothetical protein